MDKRESLLLLKFKCLFTGCSERLIIEVLVVSAQTDLSLQLNFWACVLQIHYQAFNARAIKKDHLAANASSNPSRKCNSNVVNNKKTQSEDISSFVLFSIQDKSVTNDFLNLKMVKRLFRRTESTDANHLVTLMIWMYFSPCSNECW